LTEARNRLVAVIFSEDMRSESGRVLEQQIRARVPDARIIYVDPRSAAGMRAAVADAVAAAQRVIAAVYVIPTAGRAIQTGTGLKNTVAMDDASAGLLNEILERAAARTLVLAMGNPYLVQDFPAIQNYVCAFSNATVSERAVVKALFGEIPIAGHLPVTIPGIANRGEGLERPSRAASGGSAHGR
jgi:beta-N-acetylhexosaminidase